jgi:hypothetical protein
VRIISAKLYGTTYVSRNIDVATVDANGIVTAMSVGETVIVVRNGQNETQAKVIVRTMPSDAPKTDT